MNRILDQIQRFQEYLLELGVARGVISLPAPRMSLSSISAEAAEPANLFGHLITESEIVDVARDLFVSGHYSHAVQEAFKGVEKYVATKSGRDIASATALMDFVFSPKSPILIWTERKKQSEKDEQAGYQRLFSGAMLGIRNPVTHEFNWIQDPDLALELLCFAQHLLKKAKQSSLETGNEGVST